MSVGISQFSGVGAQLFDNSGYPLTGGKIYSYAAGTTTPQATYTDSTGNTAHANPIILDSAGRVNEIWLTNGLEYKFVVKTSTDTLIGTYDNVASNTLLTDLSNTSNPALGDALVGFRQANYSGNLSGSVGKTVHDKLQDYICVHDFMTQAQITDSQGGSPTLNMTAAVQAAIDTNKSVYFPQGVYLVDSITIPTAARGSTYFGDGYYHYNNNQKTVIKARTLGQTSVFTLGNGADNITFTLMRIDGDLKAAKCVDASYGAFLTFVECGVYKGTAYGVYSKQGLMRIDRCMMTETTGVQCHMWSDSAATDSEFSSGTVALLLAAGGNRLVNIWANSSTNACVALRPFDNSTNHINTSIVNLYAGEVSNVNRPVIDIVGTSANRVQQVHISNSFIVTAVTGGLSSKIDGGVYMEYCKDIALNNIQFRGQGIGASTTSYTPWSVFAGDQVDNLTVNACTFRDINRNPIYLNANVGSVNITGCSFQDWDLDQNASGDEAAAIRISSGRVSATGNNFSIGGGQTQPFPLAVADAKMVVFDNNYMNMPTVTLSAGTGTVSGFNRFSSGGAYNGTNIEMLGGSLIGTEINRTTGQVASAGSGSAETFTVSSIPNTAVQKIYLATVSQQGAGTNTAMYFINAYGSNASAVRIAGDTASPGTTALQFQMSGLSVQLVVGSGLGALTWRWNLNQLN